FVRDAQDPDAQWDGWLPFEEMPKRLDPARGFVATANSNTDPRSCALAFTRTHCEPRYRTERIETLLAAEPLHGAATSAALQRDLLAAHAPPIRDVLVQAIGEVAGNAVAARALDQLRAWDATFPSDSSGALLFAVLQQDLPRRLFTPLLGVQLGGRYVNG